MKTQAGKCLLIALAAVFFCVGGYWFFFAGGSSGWGTGGSGQGAQQAASQSAEQEAKESKAKEDKAAGGGEAAAADAKEAQEAKPEDEAKKKDGKSVYPLQVMIMEAKRAEEIEGAAKGAQGPFLIVKATLANVGQKSVSIIPQGMSLVDTDESRHSVSKEGMEALARKNEPVFTSFDIKPGTAATASVVFSLAEDDKPAVFVIQPAGGGDAMRFHLPESVKKL